MSEMRLMQHLRTSSETMTMSDLQAHRAVLLTAGNHCLQPNVRPAEAELARAQAHVLAAPSPLYLGFLASAVRKEMPAWRQVQIDLGQNGPQ